ncbi:TetR/AcrR family transcriptional regulator [Nocardia sp. NBC_01499]|uniref:TetR/AcrR family transcriptional regulator n=1 Tax=Nocardia sp. NBC_01499 TaxID=2903597 RepID=UPI003866F0C3
MSSSKRYRPVQKRAEGTIEKILDSMAQLLEVHGYRSLTTNMIAEHAEVSIGTVYRYFSDKDQLLIALSDRATADITHMLLVTLTKMVNLGTDEMVRLFVEALVGAIEANRGVITAVVGEVPLGTQSNMLPGVEQQLEQFARIHLAIQFPELDDATIDELVYIGMGVGLSAALRIAIDRPANLDRDRLIDRTATLLTKGLFAIA